MVIKCEDSCIPRVKAYIGEDKWKCIYLYMDMLEYQAQGPNFGLWIFKDKALICGTAYQYYNALHIYCKGHPPTDDVVRLINELSPKCITGEKSLIKTIMPRLNGMYRLELSHIITINHTLKEGKKLPFIQACEEDVPKIAELMMKDKIYSSVYTYDELCQQMEEGIRLGKRRVYILRDKTGNLLVSGGTFVEAPDIVIYGGLIVDQRARGLGYGSMTAIHIANLMINEGKKVVGLVSIENEASVIMHRKIGYEFLGINARLLKDHTAEGENI